MKYQDNKNCRDCKYFMESDSYIIYCDKLYYSHFRSIFTGMGYCEDYTAKNIWKRIYQFLNKEIL